MSLVTVLAYGVSLFLAGAIIYWGFKRKSYNHIKHTISELGERGAEHARLVNYGVFLPSGVILFVIALLTNSFVQGLAVCLGVGYAVAAFFPCDVGSPTSGSTSQQIHNLGGGVEYLGGAYFIFQSNQPLLFLESKVIAGVILICAILISIPSLPMRGLVQRVAEVLLFSSLIELT